LAITDDLTGLFNARYFNHFLSKITARARQTRTPVSLLIFDIDNFKKYNDQFGHTAGDEILKAVGQMMKRCVRDHDLVARLGGDEFVVVFWDNGASRPKNVPGSAQEQAQMIERAGKPLSDPVQIFNRCKKLLSEHQFKSLGPHAKGQLTLSGGLAVFPYDADTPETLLQAADHCLMAASKKNGKNTLTLVGQDQRA
jgi:PleD family two-component response regulator